MNMKKLFEVGDELEGYCCGFFGRDDYDTKRCIMVTPTYAVFETEDKRAAVLNNRDDLTTAMVAEWKTNNYDVEWATDEE